MDKNSTKDYLMKFFRWLLVIYLALFFTMVIPFHHHADSLGRQDNCSICVAARQDHIAVASVPIAVVILTFLVFIARGNSVCTRRAAYPHLRSPPAF